MKAYMRNQFEFYGIKANLRKELLKKCWHQNPIGYKDYNNLLFQLFQFPEREFHLCAIEIAAKFKNEWNDDILNSIEHIAVEKAWWDTIDTSNSIICGPYFKRHNCYKDLQKLLDWNSSNKRWLIRLSIIFQLTYKDKLDTDLLKTFILPHTNSSEFFIQKAIGWALRNYSRTNPTWVLDFVNNCPLKPLSKREALRLIKK